MVPPDDGIGQPEQFGIIRMAGPDVAFISQYAGACSAHI